MKVWFLIAQATTDVGGLAGNAGWAGAGLLGLVLAWLLLWHLPAKDKQIKELIDGKDTLVRALGAEHTQALKDLSTQHALALEQSRDDFKEWLALISSNNNSNVKAMTEAMTRELMSLAAVVGTLRDAIKELHHN